MTAQARSLLQAWEYSPSDHLLHVLPLHHIHGTINALFTPLFSGSTIEFLFPFNADAVWKRLAAPFLTPDQIPDPQSTSPISRREKVTFFTVVPTVYSRLLTTHKTLPRHAERDPRGDKPGKPPPGDLRIRRATHADQACLGRAERRQCSPRAVRNDRGRHGAQLRPGHRRPGRWLCRVAAARASRPASWM